MKNKRSEARISRYRTLANILRHSLTEAFSFPHLADYMRSHGLPCVAKIKRKFTRMEWSLLAKEFHPWLKAVTRRGCGGGGFSEKTDVMGWAIMGLSLHEAFAVVLVLLEIKKPKAYARVFASI